jgi:hypothetical protein
VRFGMVIGQTLRGTLAGRSDGTRQSKYRISGNPGLDRGGTAAKTTEFVSALARAASSTRQRLTSNVSSRV